MALLAISYFYLLDVSQITVPTKRSSKHLCVFFTIPNEI